VSPQGISVAAERTGLIPLSCSNHPSQDGTTPVSFALQLGPPTFGIFDAFSDEAGRQAHLNGRIAQALRANAPNLLAQASSSRKPAAL
jgi:hypothetical protein